MFKDNSKAIKSAIENGCEKWIDKTAEMILNSVKENTAVDTGQTRDGWCVEREKECAVIGNPLENAVWEEFGTGEYAINGNGRKRGWYYKDKNGQFYHTYGKQPRRPFQRAYIQNLKKAEDTFKEVFK